MRIAILSINIGEYDIFWEDFYASAEKKLFTDADKEYFVFTDSNKIKSIDSKVHTIYQEDMGWPYNTMKRFYLFCKIKETLKNFDYIFFANANALFYEELKTTLFIDDKNLIVVEHPGFHYYPVEKKPFERRINCNAYVPPEQQSIYVQGAFYGGKANAFIEMIEFLNEKTEEDLANDIVAVWHDESYLNSYIINRNDIQLLGWQYLYFEEYILPYNKVIVLRNKRKYLTNSNGRFLNENFWKRNMLIKLRNIKWIICILLGIYKKESIYTQSDEYTGNNLWEN